VEKRSAEEATVGNGESLEGLKQEVSYDCVWVCDDLAFTDIEEQTHRCADFHHPLDVSGHHGLQATQGEVI
jgi:hypothetical protein